MPGKTHGGHITAQRGHVYDKLKRTMSKKKAARIANAGKTKAGRTRMARKAARTRTRRRK